MEKEFKSTLKVLQKLDDYLNVPIITKDILVEETNNINDYIDLKKEIDQLLQNLNQVNCNETDLILEHLAHLHIKFEHISWHVDQIHSLIKKSMISYVEKP